MRYLDAAAGTPVPTKVAKGSTMARKALIVQGGWEGHQPGECAEIWTPVLEGEGFEVTVSPALDSYRDAKAMAELSLIVPIWTMGAIEPEQLQGLLDAVAGGVGLAGWHGGMADSFRDSPSYQFLVGGQFIAHPDGIKEYEVKIVRGADPIVRGIGDFAVRSEQYYMHVDPGNEVLATTTFDTVSAPWVNGTVMPVVWKRKWGKGRVFYSSLGHQAADFEAAEVREIQRRGMLWASR